MHRKIRLSRRAARKLESLLNYLEIEWSLKVRNDFIAKMDRTLKNNEKFPHSFPESQTVKGLRKCVISRQTTIYYKCSLNTIDIATLFDNRQNPESLNLETE